MRASRAIAACGWSSPPTLIRRASWRISTGECKRHGVAGLRQQTSSTPGTSTRSAPACAGTERRSAIRRPRPFGPGVNFNHSYGENTARVRLAHVTQTRPTRRRRRARRDPPYLLRDIASDDRERLRARDRAPQVAARRGRAPEGARVHGGVGRDAARMAEGKAVAPAPQARQGEEAVVRPTRAMTPTDEPDPIARGARVQRLDGRFRWPGGRHV